MSGEKNPRYGIHLTNEEKKKISESRKGKCAGENHPFYGKHHSQKTRDKISKSNSNPSQETREKMSEQKKGKYDGDKNPMFGVHRYGEESPRYGKKLNEKEIISLRIAHKNEMKPVVQLDLFGNFISQYESINEASRITNINKQCLSFCLQGKYKTAGGFHWMYKEEYEQQL